MIKPETKPEINSINKTLFLDIIPRNLRVWLEPLPPTAVMKELKQFQKDFKNCSENHQLLVISQMMSFNPLIESDAFNIHVYRSIHASSFLKDWQEDIRKMESKYKIMCRYRRYMSHLDSLIIQLPTDSIRNLVLVMLQISQFSIIEHMNVIYETIIDDEMHNLIWNIPLPILSPSERANLIADIKKSSCLISRQMMVLHLQLERQMILYIQQRRDQLNQRIEMQLELETLIQYEIASLQEQ